MNPKKIVRASREALAWGAWALAGGLAGVAFIGLAHAAQPADVKIENFSFGPKAITVVKGTTVTWTNQDPTPHTVTAEKGQFDSDLLGAEDSFSWTFKDAGTFAYLCTQHANMSGTVTVTEK